MFLLLVFLSEGFSCKDGAKSLVDATWNYLILMFSRHLELHEERRCNVLQIKLISYSKYIFSSIQLAESSYPLDKRHIIY